MAGSFPDVPGMRFQYDRDGSILYCSSSSNIVGSWPLADMQRLNDESSSASAPNFTVPGYLALAWPEVRTVAGVYLSGQHGSVSTPQTPTFEMSTNTTNGADGTWTPGPTVTLYLNVDNPSFCRANITTFTAIPNLRGMRWWQPGFMNGEHPVSFHVYGQIPTTENPDKLILCDASGAVVTNGAYFDFGNAARGTTDTRSFRIKNNSSALTANSVTLNFQTLTDASPTLAGQFQYSLDGGATWVTSASLGSLGPGAMSPVITLRRNTSPTAGAGPFQTRVNAVPASMT